MESEYVSGHIMILVQGRKKQNIFPAKLLTKGNQYTVGDMNKWVTTLHNFLIS